MGSLCDLSNIPYVMENGIQIFDLRIQACSQCIYLGLQPWSWRSQDITGLPLSGDKENDLHVAEMVRRYWARQGEWVWLSQAPRPILGEPGCICCFCFLSCYVKGLQERGICPLNSLAHPWLEI